MTTSKSSKEVTGRRLKVGDKVRRAKAPPYLPGQPPRETGDMIGEVIAITPGGSGSGKIKTGRVKVRWSSGSVATHDGHMLVKVD